jgi:hypothetical protein
MGQTRQVLLERFWKSDLPGLRENGTGLQWVWANAEPGFNGPDPAGFSRKAMK